jgi:hypothetical protein
VLRFDPARAAAAARAVAPLVELVEDVLHILPRFFALPASINPNSLRKISIARGNGKVTYPSPFVGREGVGSGERA